MQLQYCCSTICRQTTTTLVILLYKNRHPDNIYLCARGPRESRAEMNRDDGKKKSSSNFFHHTSAVRLMNAPASSGHSLLLLVYLPLIFLFSIYYGLCLSLMCIMYTALVQSLVGCISNGKVNQGQSSNGDDRNQLLHQQDLEVQAGESPYTYIYRACSQTHER